MAALLNRNFQRQKDLLAFAQPGYISKVFGNGFTGSDLSLVGQPRARFYGPDRCYHPGIARLFDRHECDRDIPAQAIRAPLVIQLEKVC